MLPQFNKPIHQAFGMHDSPSMRFALVRYGGGVIQMSGSIAGDTFARNRSGNYSRARTKPVNPNSAGQNAVRSALTELTTRWAQTLTALQRAAWNLYAANVAMKNRLGEVIYLSGSNHYIRSNSWLARLGLTIVDDGPVIFELPAKDPSFAITASEATQKISVTFDNTMDWASETGAWMELYQGQPQNAQRNFFAGPWRRVLAITGVDGAPPPSPHDAPVDFAISQGQHQWMYARIRRLDGRLSEPFRNDCYVGA
ncbi:MAG: hypothetical protein HWN68_16695 [Desulfobacterales bacterium]|nr:hypothetical protein [Desulfobacterales bacterium]